MDEAIQAHFPKVLLLCPFLKLLVVEFFNSYACLNYLAACHPVDDDRLMLTGGQNNSYVDLWIFAERVAFARSSKCLFGFLVHLIGFRVEILVREIFREAVTKVDSEGPRMGGISE